MAALPYMPLYVADYLADAAHLSTLEHGAYLLLIMTYWQRGEPLPAEDRRLARIARLTPEEWAEVRPAIAEFFDDRDGAWHHGRIDRELANVREKSEKASAAGKASAARRSKGRSTSAQPSPNAGSTSVERPLNGRQAAAQRTRNHTDTETDKYPLPLPSGGSPPPISGVAETRHAVDPVDLPPDDGPLDMQVQRAFAAWNELAAEIGLKRADHATGSRRRKLREILAAHGLAGWQRGLTAVRASTFLRGENDKGWQADLNFVLEEDHFAKLLEGGFAPSTGPPAANQRRPTAKEMEPVFDRIWGRIREQDGEAERDDARDTEGRAGADPGADGGLVPGAGPH